MSKDSKMQEMYDQGWSKAAEYFRPALRDNMAMAALQGWLASWPDDESPNDAEEQKLAAKLAYELADAMLEARK